MTSSQESQGSQESHQSSGGAKEARQKASERLGQWINRKYCLESLLGVGGMATVYAARHRNGSRIALKMMHAEFSREEGVKTRFLREGYVANKVDHPGVVKILDDDESEHGEPFLVMELLEGETLQQLWKRRKRKVPAAEALGIAEAVLDTLEPFHELKIVHRDLKPANIFITNDGEVKLLDFGVAQMREKGEAMTRAGTALGTPSFMSPEQAMGKSEQLDGRSDVFSIGATLYAVLSGKRLHHGKSDNEAFILAATQPAPSLARVAPDLDTEVIALVDRALQWDRRKRFRSAADMRDECRRIREKLGGAAPIGLPQAPPPPQVAERPSIPTLGETPAARQAANISISGGQPAMSAQQAAMAVETIPPEPRARAVPPPPPSRGGRPSQSAVAAQPAPAIEVQAAEPTPLPEKLVDVFDRLERSLPTLRQYGFEHPEGRGRLKAIHRSVLDAFREMPQGIRWQVHPFCFTYEHTTLWEPTPPFDVIPYNLASAGLEEVELLAGLTEDELTRFLMAVLLDPSKDEDHDIAAALWEARFLYVRCRIRDDLTEADATEQSRFFAEADDLEQLAKEDLAEVAAMAVSTDKASFEAAKQASRALELDPAQKAALGAQLSLDPERWRERFYDVIADAISDAFSREEPQLVLDRLSHHSWVLVKRERYDELFDTFDTIHDRLAMHPEAARWGATPAAIAGAVFDLKAIGELFKAIGNGKLSEATQQRVLQGLEAVLKQLDGSLCVDILTLADGLDGGPLFDLAMRYVDGHVNAHIGAVVERLDHQQPALAQRMLATITESRSPEAISLLKPLLMSSNPALRCEATALLATSHEVLGKQLVRLLESNDAALRDSAITTLLRHQVRPAGPGLVHLIESDGFMDRPVTEQERLFDTLYTLNPPRAESLLCSIVQQHGMLADDRVDQTRAAAAASLGKFADSSNPMDALENAARRRPWNTQALRMAAGAAAEAIGARLRSGGGGGGS